MNEMNDLSQAKEKDTELKPEQEKKSLFSRLSDYLTGRKHDQENEELKESKSDNFPGFFDFVFRKWKEGEPLHKSENEDESSPEIKPGGFFQKVTKVYNSYQKAKEDESEKLNVYESINQGARLSKEFMVLLFTSCFIATMGLFQNSAAVIIGAMIIAPLMMPILGFSLGTIWGDKRLLTRSILTLFLGSLVVLAISSSLSMMLPGVELNEHVNEQIKARINPNLYDIIIALASGLVGAYAFVNPRVSSTISGVAISVALMPPLCTVGIALGHWELQAAAGASLLYLTNLVSIALAASLVFWRLRIHPVTESKDKVKVRAKRKVFLATFMLLLISIPLAYFMRETYILKEKQTMTREIIMQSLPEVTILNLDIHRYSKSYDVKAVLVLAKNSDSVSIAKVKSKIRLLFPDNATIHLITLGQTKKNNH